MFGILTVVSFCAALERVDVGDRTCYFISAPHFVQSFEECRAYATTMRKEIPPKIVATTIGEHIEHANDQTEWAVYCPTREQITSFVAYHQIGTDSLGVDIKRYPGKESIQPDGSITKTPNEIDT